MDLVLLSGLPFHLPSNFGSKTLLLLSKSGFQQLYFTLHLYLPGYGLDSLSGTSSPAPDILMLVASSKLSPEGQRLAPHQEETVFEVFQRGGVLFGKLDYVLVRVKVSYVLFSRRENTVVALGGHCYTSLIGCICLTFLHCASSNVSLNCLPKKMQSQAGCVCLAFRHYVFSNVFSNFPHEQMKSHIECICLTFLQCVFSNVSS